ncbi:MAG: DUF4386 family protein [Arthrobacter sp.]
MEQPRTQPLGHARGAAADSQSWRQLYFWAGISAVAFVALLIVAVVLDAVAPPPIHGGADTLEFIARHKAVYIAEQLLWTVPNILPVLVFVTLFVALAPLNKSLALMATVVGALPWALFLAVPVTSRGSMILVNLSDSYANAIGTAGADARLRYAAAAEAVIAENNTPAAAGVLSALGILLISLTMLKGVLPRAVAWLGVAAGAVGVVAEALRLAVPEVYLVYGILMWAWFTAVGIALIRLSRRTPRAGGAAA